MFITEIPLQSKRDFFIELQQNIMLITKVY